MKQLTKELEEFKTRANFSDNPGPPTVTKTQVIPRISHKSDCVNLIRSLPEESHVFQICNKFSESCRPFGTKKIELLDDAFDSICDNMFCGGTKLLLYILDKDIPRSKAEYESYSKLGKFQRHAKYPDPLVRKYIEDNLILNLSNDQYHDFLTNQMQQFVEFKKEVREAISTLFQAKFKVYKAIMFLDLLKTKLTTKTISKSQLMNLAQQSKTRDMKISFEQIFNIQKEDVEVEKRIEIPDPKAFAKAAIHGVQKSETGELPSFVSDTYHTTLLTCSDNLNSN